MHRVCRPAAAALGRLSDVRSVSEPIATPRVRALVRWGIPLHLAVPAAVGVLGVLLLVLGGAPALLGGWWLATALPIAIGGFYRDPRLAAIPAALWVAWVLVGALAGADAGLANTPVALAIFLGALGAGATLLAQRAIFPATDPEVWESHAEHAAPEAKAAGPETSSTGSLALPAFEDDDADLDPSLEEAIDEDDLQAAEDAYGEPTIAAATVAEDPPTRPPADEAPARAAALASKRPVVVPEPRAELTLEGSAPASAAKPAVETPEPPALPLDADPAALDEGGHVTEFAALTEADLAEPPKS